MTDNGGPVKAESRLYLTRDSRRLVPEGDPEAWTLFCTPGSLVPREQAARYGLLTPPQPEPEPEPDPVTEAEMGEETPAPKQRAARAKPRAARTKPRTSQGSKSDDAEA